MKFGALKVSVVYFILCVTWVIISGAIVALINDKLFKDFLNPIQILMPVLFMLMNALFVFKLVKLNNKTIGQKEYDFLSLYLVNPSPLWIYDLATLKFVSVNEAAIASYGYSREEFLRMTVNEILTAGDYAKIAHATNQHTNIPYTADIWRTGGVWQHQKKDGSIIYANITSHKIKFENKDCVMVLASDTTGRIEYEQELKQINQSLNEEKQKLKETERLAKVSGWEYYPKSRSMIWSDELYRIFDLEPQSEKVDYALVLKMVHPDDLTDYNKAVEGLLRRQEELNIVYRFMTKTGKLKYIRVLGKACYQDNKFFKVQGTMQDVTELKNIQKEKNHYLRRLKVTLNNINDGYCHISRDWLITDLNTSCEKLLNVKRKDIINKPLFDIFPEVKKADTQKSINKVLKERLPAQYEDYNAVNEKWFCMNAYPTDEGAAIYFSDISNTKLKDIQLKQAVERYDLIAKATQDVIYDWDASNDKTAYGHNINDLLDIPDDKVAENDKEWWKERIHPDDLAIVAEKYRYAIENKATNIRVEYRLRTNTGKYKYVYDQGYLQYNKDRELVRIIGAFKDIDQLKRFDDENKRLADIITKVNNMIIIQDIDGKITWVNKAFETFTGYTLCEVAGKKFPEVLFGPETDINGSDYLKSSIKELKRFSYEVINYTKQQKKFWVNIEFTPLFNVEGKPEGYISIHTDISIQKEKEEKISRQNEILRNIAWMSSHELRKPVASILGLIELINETTDETDKDESIRMMQTCTKYLDEIIHKINHRIEQEISEEL